VNEQLQRSPITSRPNDFANIRHVLFLRPTVRTSPRAWPAWPSFADQRPGPLHQPPIGEGAALHRQRADRDRPNRHRPIDLAHDVHDEPGQLAAREVWMWLRFSQGRRPVSRGPPAVAPRSSPRSKGSSLRNCALIDQPHLRPLNRGGTAIASAWGRTKPSASGVVGCAGGGRDQV